tara:strand:- start:1324 stop:4476 length:3153 start_codon:yes stop_codon:yes gene_type:complete
MADYAISNVPRRVVYAASGTGPYAFTFEILDQTDIAVYKASTLLTLTTDYTVTINANGTGSVTLVLTAGTSNITIVGAKNIQRTTDFTTGGDLFANTLNDELDNQTIYIQQVAETAERGLKAPVTDPTDIAMTLPAKVDRKGKVLAFDSTTGNPVSGPALDAVVTVIEQSANINTVADNIADVIVVADNTSNINTVSGISGNVTTVAGIAANVTAVAGNATNVNTVATNIANVNTVGGISANVTTVAGISAAVTSVAADASDIGTVAANIANVNAVAAIDADVSAVAGDATNIGIVAADIADVNTVAGIAANVTTVASISTNVVAVDANSTNVNTVATNIANVNIVGNNISNVNAVASNSTNINSVAGNSANINTVAGIASDVTTVATNNANVTTVAGSIANVNTNATNIANINQNAANIVAIQGASANASTATTQAGIATTQAAAASASAAAASAVALGNEPVRHSIRPSLLLDFANTKQLDPRITFTRASTATNYDGKTVAKAEENLFTYSQEFDNAAWVKVSNASVTANSTVSPDGTTTADTVTADGSSGSKNIYQLRAASATGLVYSVFAKAGTNNFVQLWCSGDTNVHANFDLSSGTAGTTGSAATSSIQSVGNGWYRCVLITASAIAANCFIALVSSSSASRNETNNLATTIYVWGAQVENRSTVTAYTPTTTTPITNYIPVLQTAASGTARFDHNPTTGESLGLLIEEQRTNVLLYSTDYSNAIYWSGLNFTKTASATVSPDGTLNATLMTVNNGTSGNFQTTTYAVTAGVPVTLSFYAKANGFTSFTSREYIATGNTVTWNLSTGVATTNGSMTPVGNGWYRCSWVFTPVTAQTIAGFTIFYQLGGGNGYKGVFLWGAQLEAGSFATSYIPTVASQVTRSADSASMTGTNFSSWYRADEGTFYAEAYSPKGGDTAGNSSHLFSVIDAGLGNRIRIFRNANKDQFTFEERSGGSVNVTVNSGALADNTLVKVGFALKTNDFAAVRSSTVSGTDTSGAMPALPTTFEIGGFNSTNLTQWNSTINKIAYYPKRLTNAEIQGLTTI